jgi:hypothetical protein
MSKQFCINNNLTQIGDEADKKENPPGKTPGGVILEN